MAFADGGFKYQPYNWRDDKVSASVYYSALLRHLSRWWAGDDYASDTPQVHNLASVVACCAIILDAQMNGMLNDDRPPKNPAFDALMDDMQEKLAELQARESTKYGLHEINTRGKR